MATRKEITTISVNNSTKKALNEWFDPDQYKSWDVFMQDVVRLIKEFGDKLDA